MNRDIQALVLALLGAATLRLSVTDAFLAYVREPMKPFLIISGVLLLALAVWSALRDGEGTSHGHGGPAVAWLLLLPVLAIFLVAPPPLGVEAASRDSGIVAYDQPLDWPPLPPDDPASIDLDEFSARTLDASGQETLDGRAVEMTGFSSPTDDGGWYLTRFVAQCCAADAAAIKVEVRGAADPGEGQWVEVVGTYDPTPAEAAGEDPPVVAASSVRPVPEPVAPYL